MTAAHSALESQQSKEIHWFFSDSTRNFSRIFLKLFKGLFSKNFTSRFSEKSSKNVCNCFLNTYSECNLIEGDFSRDTSKDIMKCSGKSLSLKHWFRLDYILVLHQKILNEFIFRNMILWFLSRIHWSILSGIIPGIHSIFFRIPPNNKHWVILKALKLTGILNQNLESKKIFSFHFALVIFRTTRRAVRWHSSGNLTG